MTTIQPDHDPVGVFFWARSGGGHRTAKEGVKQQKIKEYEAKGKTLDTKHDYDITGEKVLSSVKFPFVGGLGEVGVSSWDEAQKKGDLQFLKTYASLGWIGEIIFYPLVYFKVKAMLQDLNVEPEFIVSTQAFCLKAIVHAMQTVNKEKNWKMHMNVYLTDLPSKKAIHFFPSIRRVTVNKDLGKLLTLHAPPPLLGSVQTLSDERDFWRKHCGKIKVITNEQFPIREAFLETAGLKKRLENPAVNVNLKLNHPAEREIIRSGLSTAVLNNAVFNDDQVTLNVRDKDKMTFMMLGSQPTTESVLSWLKTFVDSGRQGESESLASDDRQHYFFLYVGVAHTEMARNLLLDAVGKEIDRLKKDGQLPSNFNIVPFTNQGADEIALLMARSDVSITRSGGATSMELLQLDQSDLPKRANKLTLIHSEALLSQERSPLAYDNSEFVKKVMEDIVTQVDKRSLLDSDEWRGVRRNLEEFCEQEGYSKRESQRIVDNILRLYIRSPDETEKPVLSEILKSLQMRAEISAKKPFGDETVIEQKMKEMQQKAKYQEVSLASLRQLAIENILTRDGIVLWETGNAKYLKKKIGAHVVNPQYASELLKRTIKENY